MSLVQAYQNPHYVYNTLEFLHVFAVAESQDEFIDIIYEFSSLL